jgi:hypothetical protein
MLLSKSPKIRKALYFTYGVGSLALTYLGAKGVAGPDEIAAWTGLGVLFSVVAGGNVGNVADPELDEVT